MLGNDPPGQCADGGIVLDFTRMNRILELDRDTMTVTVEPGILLEDLQRYVEIILRKISVKNMMSLSR